MKKITGFIAILVLALVLTACGSKEETRTFELEQPGVKVTITYTHKGDKATKQTAENLISYEEIGLESKEQAQGVFDPLVEEFEDIKGVTHEMKYSDTTATEKLTIDFTEADFDEINDLPGMMLDGDSSKGVSMKASAEMLEDQGFTEIK